VGGGVNLKVNEFNKGFLPIFLRKNDIKFGIEILFVNKIDM
jgi:hypothetical protein